MRLRPIQRYDTTRMGGPVGRDRSHIEFGLSIWQSRRWRECSRSLRIQSVAYVSLELTTARRRLPRMGVSADHS